MMLTRFVPVLGLLLLTGCATQRITQELPADHPANPAAAEAAPPQRSATLSLATADPLPRGGRPSPMAGEGSGAASHGGMQHGADHAQHAGTAPATRPAATQPGRTLFMCPMHPEVTSTNPDDRCPKCNMKVNKPVKQQTPGATTRPAPAPADKAAHEGHGGQHR